jgi:hypothetical protein
MPGSVKALDLLRDPRAYIHTPVLDAALGRPGEFKARARAVPVQHERMRGDIRDEVERSSGWRPAPDWHLFRIEIEGAAYHEYDEGSDIHVVKRWTPERGSEMTTRTIPT